MELQTILNTYATDIFRNQADFDYISARANFRMKLRQQFLWSAQQAIEKYLKSILLFNGKSARFPSGVRKEFGHNLEALMNEVGTIPIFSFSVGSDNEKFIQYLSEQGPNRYLSKTAYNPTEALRQLDSTIWHIRRYCQYVPDRGVGCLTPIPGLQEAYIKKMLNPAHTENPYRFTIPNGGLEKIIKLPSSDPARKALVWANLFYGAKRRNFVRYRTFSSFEVPPNDREWLNVDWKIIENYIRL